MLVRPVVPPQQELLSPRAHRQRLPGARPADERRLVRASYVATVGIVVLGVAVGFAALFLGISFWLGPKRPSLLKDSTYECGIPARSTVQIRFFIRFFLVALLPSLSRR